MGKGKRERGRERGREREKAEFASSWSVDG
jgi:hypothetical protein